MKIGVMDSVIGGASDRERFDRARRIGCSGVEATLTRDQLRSSVRLASLRSAMQETSLEVPSFCLDEHNLGGIAAADRQVAEVAAEDVRIAIAWAAELGADAILVPFFSVAELLDETGFDRAVAAFRELCPLAAEQGVVLAYEGTLPAGRVRELAARIESPAFGCYFDLANLVVRALDPPTEIRALGDLVCRVHVKDVLARKNDSHPGLGRVDFAECARALAEVGYNGWLVLETPAAPPPLVQRDVAFTRSAFGILDGAAWPTFGAFSYELDDWADLVETFARLGLGAVQLGDPLLAACLDDRGEVARCRTVLEEHEISLAGLAGYRNLIAPEDAARRANVLHVRRCLEAAPRLGTWVVATEAGTRSRAGDWTEDRENWGRDAWRLLEDAIEELLPVAEETGVILALEGHPNTVLKTQSHVLELLARYPSPHLQLVCDPYNYMTFELLPAERRLTDELLARFESRFVLAHLKDVGVDGTEVTRPEFGTGVFQHAPYLEFLRSRRPDLPLILEHLPLEHIPNAIRLAGELLDADHEPLEATARAARGASSGE